MLAGEKSFCQHQRAWQTQNCDTLERSDPGPKWKSGRNDINGNAKRRKELKCVTIFLDTNGNFQLDENETSFKPSEDGKFSEIVTPRSILCPYVFPDNQEANVTFPIEEHKSYLTWINFERPRVLLFGIQDSGSGKVQMGHPPNPKTTRRMPNQT